VNVAGTQRDIVRPAPESAMRVDSLNPFGKERAFGTVAVGVLTLGLQHQYVTRRQPDQEVRSLFPDHAPVDVEHLEAEMVVLHPGGHLGGMV